MRFPFVVTRCMVVSFSTGPGPHAGPSGGPPGRVPPDSLGAGLARRASSFGMPPRGKTNGGFWTGQEKTEKTAPAGVRPGLPERKSAAGC